VLGTLRSVQDLFDATLNQSHRPAPRNDLFTEWQQEYPDSWLLFVAEATVLARLGALLHDICHVPFGHTVEDDLAILTPHDKNRERFKVLWQQISGDIRDGISKPLRKELEQLILSKDEELQREPSRYPFVADLVGNTICGDLLDYIRRDHLNLGLPIALGHRFTEGLFVSGKNHLYPARVIVETERDGRERPDVFTELIKYMRYRYEETERVLTHHAKLAADAMIGNLLSLWKDALFTEVCEGMFPDLPEGSRNDVDHLRAWLQSRDPVVLEGAIRELSEHIKCEGLDHSTALDLYVESELEKAFLLHGDDGLLEWLYASSVGIHSPRREAIAHLSASVLNRNLYKPIAVSSSGNFESRERVWNAYGSPEARRRLQSEAAYHLELEHEWLIALWIANPEMRLKPAEVYVGTDESAEKLEERSSHVWGVYDSHRRLWHVGVYVDPALKDDVIRRDSLLAWLKKKMQLPADWVPSVQESSTEEVVVREKAVEHDLTPSEQAKVLEGLASLDPSASERLSGIVRAVEDRVRVIRSL
jgi:HD superfamily phosphohydrolase